MTNLTLSIVLQAAALMTGGHQSTHQYNQAYQQTAETGRPLLVLVGADWCPGCRQMKDSVMPQLERQGTFKKVALAYVNSDQQQELAGKLMQGGSIPQLILFKKSGKRWVRQQLTGAHSLGDTKNFISQGAKPATPNVRSQ